MTGKPAQGRQPVSRQPVFWNREELGQILRVYGRKVASGDWRDYAIDSLGDRAVFSVFRRSSEAPLYRVEKNPGLARKQGAYCVVSTTGLVLRRGRNLARVLGVLDKKRNVLRLVDQATGAG